MLATADWLMAYLTDVTKEIGNVATLKNSGASEAIILGLAKSLATKIMTIQAFDTSSAITLGESIKDAALDEPITKLLADANNARMEGCIDDTMVSHRSAGAPPRDQVLREVYNYLTGIDWGVVDNPDSTPDKRDNQVANRLVRLGVRRASDIGLVKWAITLILDAEFRLTGQWPSYWTTYDRVLRFKKLLQNHPKFDGPFIDKYTEFPANLPKEIFKIAYDENDPPISRPIRNFDSISQHVPLRSVSKLLQGSKRDSPNSKDSGAEVAAVLSSFMSHQSQHRHRDWDSRDWYSSDWSVGGGGNSGSHSYAGFGSQSYGGGPSEAQPATCVAHVTSEEASSMLQQFQPPSRLSGVDKAKLAAAAKAVLAPPAVVARRIRGKQHPSKAGSVVGRAVKAEPAYGSAVKAEPADGSVVKAEPLLAVAPTAAVKPEPASNAVHDGTKRLSSEDIEEQAFRRLKEVKVAKAAAAKASKKANAATASGAAKAGGAVRKGGQRATKVKKEKLGEVVSMGYKVVWDVKGGDPKRKRNTFMCLHYDRVKRMLGKRRPEPSAIDAKRTCGYWHDVAGSTWDHHMVKK